MVERNAMKTINDMEIKLDGYINLVYGIKGIISDNISCKEKLVKILNQINDSEKEM